MSGAPGVPGRGAARRLPTVLVLFGTRPEAIKLAPVMEEIGRMPGLRSLHVCTAQHRDLLETVRDSLGLRIDHDLDVMRPHQSPAQVVERVLGSLTPLLQRVRADLLLVQGDTTSTLAGALCGFYHRIPVGHVEAGLRSGDPQSPFPEEMNRRLVTRLARLHFAATERNAATLRSEGVPPEWIFVTGNPVVDGLHRILSDGGIRSRPTEALLGGFEVPAGSRLVVLTTHRRESFGDPMRRTLEAIRRFAEAHPDVRVVFPVHPNPSVLGAAHEVAGGHPRICLLPPLPYPEFVALLSRAWLIVSDSGGVQEEAPSLGVPLLVIRENTERPEAAELGCARLVPPGSERLAEELESEYRARAPDASRHRRENPFGRGDAGAQIARIVAEFLHGGDRVEPARAAREA